jgi:hypothetical protein
MREMLDLVKQIDFCQVKQLFHPTSPLHESDAGGLKEHWWWLQTTLFTEMFPSRDGDVSIFVIGCSNQLVDLFYRGRS